MMDQTAGYFLQDFAELLYERAKEARERCKQLEIANDNSEATRFECGRALAYYEVVSLFVSQARIFDLLGTFASLSNLDPDQLLD
jgi:hypothetical protein